MPREPQLHNLRHNVAERSPRRLITLDTETRWTTTPSGEHHTLRLYVASLDLRIKVNGQRPPPAWAAGVTSQQLAEQIDAWTDGRVTTWVYAHNLAFDLVVTRLPVELAKLGWELTQHALTIDSPWARLKRGRRRLTLADSASWLPLSVKAIGDLLRIPKPQLPENDDSDDAWLERCAGDVQITRAALLQLLDWWDAERLGCWSLTGAASGWNAYRHRHHAATVVIDPEPEARAWERSAITSGRREVWRRGALRRSTYVELDIERAHLTACRHFLLPTKRSRAFDSLPVNAATFAAPHWQPMADCLVKTQTPRYPLLEGGRVWFPVGEFWTRLAGPEMKDACERGDLLEIGSGYLYRLGPSMTRWAAWIDNILDGHDDTAPPAALLAAKGWSRRVPGKWATRTGRTVSEGPSWDQQWHIERGVHHPSDAPCVQLHVAGRRWLIVNDQDADDSFPAVLAWVQSLTRLALNTLVDHFGPDRVITCNTDGLLVEHTGPVNTRRLSKLVAPFTVRHKGTYHDAEVISPQHLLLDGERRLSGVPMTATEAGRLAYIWQTWPKLTTQLEQRGQPGYARASRHVNLDTVPVNRWVLTDGSTVPVLAAAAAPGAPQLLISGYQDHWPPKARLAPSQHPYLVKLLRRQANDDDPKHHG